MGVFSSIRLSAGQVLDTVRGFWTSPKGTNLNTRREKARQKPLMSQSSRTKRGAKHEHERLKSVRSKTYTRSKHGRYEKPFQSPYSETDLTSRAAEFQYKPLDPTGDKIRVVKVVSGPKESIIKCEMKDVSLSEYSSLQDGQRYVAISYEWGSEDAQVAILLNSGRFVIRRNLHNFLRAWQGVIVKGPNRWLWIDAICIDQSNDSEKSSQVQRMGDLFRNADEVMVWLGEGSREVQKAFKIIQDWVPDTGRRRACYTISSLSYWKRLWVVQELILARRAILQYGTRQLSWKALGAAFQELSIGDCIKQRKVESADASSTTACWNGESDGAPPIWQKSTREMVQIHRYWKNWSTNDKPTLFELLTVFEDSKCRHWQDRVYGLLSLVRDGENFVVDYSEDFPSFRQRVIDRFASSDLAVQEMGGDLKTSSEVMRILLDRIRRTRINPQQGSRR